MLYKLSVGFDKLYGKDYRDSKIIASFSLLAIFISCMGLFGLALYIIENRTKEMGIRKVCGATSSTNLKLVSRDFFIWIVISFIISVPIAYNIIKSWLNNFAYRINIGWHIFIYTGFMILIITGLTISYQAIRAARRNPVEALRYE